MSTTTFRRNAGVYRLPVDRRVTSCQEPDPVVQLCRTANTLRAHLERTVLHDADLTWTTYEVLTLVCARQVVEPPAIAAEIGIARTTVTKSLALLTDRRLIQRDLHEHDLRRVVVRPTRAGVGLAGMLQRRVDARQTDLFADPDMPSESDFAEALRMLADRARPADAGTDHGSSQ